MKRLNHGRPRKYGTGDLVVIYFPSKGLNDQWKAKHLPRWRGPMRVVQRLSNSTYEVKELSTGRVFQRNVANINKYQAVPVDKKQRDVEAKHLSPWTLGDVVAAKDTPDAKEFWLAEVKAVDADEVTLHYYGTTSKKRKNAQFRPAHMAHWVQVWHDDSRCGSNSERR